MFSFQLKIYHECNNDTFVMLLRNCRRSKYFIVGGGIMYIGVDLKTIIIKLIVELKSKENQFKIILFYLYIFFSNFGGESSHRIRH